MIMTLDVAKVLSNESDSVSFKNGIMSFHWGGSGRSQRATVGVKKAGIIRESRSPYVSPIVIVRKKNGTLRMCMDYMT